MSKVNDLIWLINKIPWINIEWRFAEVPISERTTTNNKPNQWGWNNNWNNNNWWGINNANINIDLSNANIQTEEEKERLLSDLEERLQTKLEASDRWITA